MSILYCGYSPFYGWICICNIINGDRIIGLCALDYKQRGRLAGNAIAVTSMSNLGLVEAMKRADIRTEITPVGDRYVIERMRELELNLGGEQSGHLIFSDYATTGDGIISALHVLKVMKKKNATLHDLAYGFMEEYPQKLVNIPVRERVDLAQLPQLNTALSQARSALGDKGRVLVRYSGTENKIRILTEAQDAAVMEKWSSNICDIIRKELA